MKLSIIIPVYNAEGYLPKCLNSVFNQDIPYPDYEVILINDGSQDNSEEIILKYKNKFPNLIYIKQKNGGPSIARNTGINHANGEYIWFIDADDWLTSNCLKGLLNYVDKLNLDFCGFKHQSISNEFVPNKGLNEELENIVVDKLTFIQKNYTIPTTPWVYIFRKSILQTHHLRFTEGILHEDYEFNIRLLSHCNRISSYPSKEGLYNYCSRPSSIMTNTAPEHYLKRINGYVHILNMIREQFPYDPKVKDYAFYVNRLANDIMVEHFIPLFKFSNLPNVSSLFKKIMTNEHIKYNLDAVYGISKIKFSLLSLVRTNFRASLFLIELFDRLAKFKIRLSSHPKIKR